MENLIILEQFNMEDCKPIGTPLDANTLLPKVLEDEHEEHLYKMEQIPYQKKIGSLMYAMAAIKPDLTSAISVKNRFMSKPYSMHWITVKQIMQYFKNSINMRLRIGGKHVKPKGHLDADWADDVKKYRSLFGYHFLLEMTLCCGITNNKKW